MPLNPWLVDNIEAFSFYCCPECVFRSKEENFFQVHALQNHGLAKSFFLDPEKNGTESNQSIFYGDKTNQVQVKKEVFEKDEGNIIPKVKLEIDDDLEWNSSWQFKDPLFMPVLSQSRKKDSRNQTQEHVERSHTYKCEQCGKRCKNDKQLDLHVLQHKSVELIYCPESECSEEIVQKFLKDHLKIVHNVEIDQATTSWVQGNVKELQCKDCGRECRDQKHYDNHKYYHKRHHSGKTKTKSVKNKVKSEEETSTMEVDQSEATKIDQSETGEIKYEELEGEKGDITITNKGLKEFQCEECGKQCKNKKSFKSHMFYHKNVQNGPHITCVECNIEVPEKLFQRHIKKVHEKEKKPSSDIWEMDFFKSRKKSSIVGLKRYWNDFCRRSYINQENPPTEELYSEYFRERKEAGETDKEMWNIYLNLRKLAFHAFNQKLRDYPTVKQYLVYADRERLPSNRKAPGICPHCGEHFRMLHDHILYKHTVDKPFKCTECDFAHAMARGLKGHMRSAHANEEDLKICHICFYKASSNQNLKKHIEAKHEKVKNFECPQCDHKFYAKATMVRHIQTYHSETKPYTCEQCGKSFKIVNKLNIHIRLVHEGKKHSCEFCGREYNCPKSLKEHKFKMHGIDKTRKYKYGNV